MSTTISRTILPAGLRPVPGDLIQFGRDGETLTVSTAGPAEVRFSNGATARLS